MANVTSIELKKAEIRLRAATAAVKSWKHGTFSYTGGVTEINMQMYALKELMKAALVAAHPNIIYLYKVVPLPIFNQINFNATKAYVEADKAWRYFIDLISKESPDVLSKNAVRQIAIQEIQDMGDKVCLQLCANVNWNYYEILDELNSDKKITLDLGFTEESNAETTDFVKSLLKGN